MHQARCVLRGHFWQYLKRLFGKEHHDVLEREGASKAIFQNHTHFQLEQINIHFDAHPENLKSPRDAAPSRRAGFEWRRKNRGGDLCCSPWNIAICGSQAGTAVHHLAFGWEQSYLQANPLDRIVRMLHGAQMRARETYVNLPAERREKIKLIKFEQLASNPEQVIDSVALFLNTQRTRATTRIVRKLKLPWSNINNILASQRKELDDELSENATMLLDEMIDDYHTGWSS